MLRFAGLSKAFGRKQVIHAASGELHAGAFALQGPNGAGKSTLLALLAGAIEPDAGEVWIDGISLRAAPVAARKRLGYAPDKSPVYPFVTGRDWLDFVADAKQCARDGTVKDMVGELGLTPYLATAFAAMSLGTQKKFLLCAAWIGEAPVMLLDEPSNGLDRAARDAIARRIAKRSAQVVTLFASHDAAFVEACGATVLGIGDVDGHQDGPGEHSPAGADLTSAR